MHMCTFVCAHMHMNMYEDTAQCSMVERYKSHHLANLTWPDDFAKTIGALLLHACSNLPVRYPDSWTISLIYCIKLGPQLIRSSCDVCIL